VNVFALLRGWQHRDGELLAIDPPAPQTGNLTGEKPHKVNNRTYTPFGGSGATLAGTQGGPAFASGAPSTKPCQANQ
jgi:hypothetical protein